MFFYIYNQAMGGSWGFVPLSMREIEHLSKGLRYLIEPRLALVGEVGGKPIGEPLGLGLTADEAAQHSNHLENFGDRALIERHHRKAPPDELSDEIGLQIRERQHEIRLQPFDLVESRVDERGDPLYVKLTMPEGTIIMVGRDE